MKDPKEIRIDDFDYHLPEENIAYYPTEKRSDSKLLHFDGSITDHTFSEVPEILDRNHLLFFNNSRVINARMWFRKPTGKIIEIFCLEPSEEELTVALSTTKTIKWNCYVGGAKRWKSGNLTQVLVLGEETVELSISKGVQIEDYYQVEFTWDSDHSFSEVIEVAGKVPLPPYIKREDEIEDEERYQTVYSKIEGSVAAPTAGLHFTEEILESLSNMGVGCHQLTLHVGAGTFKPVNSEKIGDHFMHVECFEATKDSIKAIADSDKKIIAVGTTSVRTLESMYWLGCQLKSEGFKNEDNLVLEQWEVYQETISELSIRDSFLCLLEYMDSKGTDTLFAETKLMITPNYQFKVVRGMFTNFHLPKSTLLLLVSGLIGDAWKDVYNHALANDYRFLSYGDSSLLMIQQ